MHTCMHDRRAALGIRIDHHGSGQWDRGAEENLTPCPCTANLFLLFFTHVEARRGGEEAKCSRHI